MLRSSFRTIFLSIVCLLLSSGLTFGQETRTVTAEGVAAVRQGAMDITRDAAIEDARKRAVEQAVGIFVDSQTLVENYQVINDRVLSQVKKYITGYSVIGESEDSGLLRVKITADVAVSKLGEDLSAIKALTGLMRRGATRPVVITITGLNKAEFAKFKDVLRNQVRGISDLHERSFSGTKAKISVDSRTSAQQLSNELALKDFGTFTVEVTGSTANSLELRAAPR